MGGYQKVIVPLGISANLYDANKIARAVGGRLPSVASDVGKLKGMDDFWSCKGIALPVKEGYKGREIVDSISKLSFKPHSNFEERLGVFAHKHPEAAPAILFNTQGELPNFEICSMVREKSGIIVLQPENSLPVRIFLGEAHSQENMPDTVLPLAIACDFTQTKYIYVNAVSPEKEKPVAVELVMEMLLGRAGNALEGAKGALRDEIYYPILAAVAALRQSVPGEEKRA
ncbi:MAG: hypothetical protein WC861_02760 [Candidatus Micrarchaeia archaeon]|jgi:hypothetical protein